MGLRFDINKEEDRKFLESRGLGHEIRALLSSKPALPKVTNGSDNSETIRDDQGASINKSKRSKYGNHRTYCSVLDKVFDSKGEHDTYHILLNLQRNGLISGLKSESVHDLVVEDKIICRIELDYEFIWLNKIRYADYKSVATLPQGFRIKAKLFEALKKTKIHIIYKDQDGIIQQIIDTKP